MAIGKPGPFEIIKNEGTGLAENSMVAPRRRYSCSNYETCLNVACALDWDSFTCRGCCGEMNEALVWRARQAIKKDRLVNKLCEKPEIRYLNTGTHDRS